MLNILLQWMIGCVDDFTFTNISPFYPCSEDELSSAMDPICFHDHLSVFEITMEITLQGVLLPSIYTDKCSIV